MPIQSSMQSLGVGAGMINRSRPIALPTFVCMPNHLLGPDMCCLPRHSAPFELSIFVQMASYDVVSTNIAHNPFFKIYMLANIYFPPNSARIAQNGLK